MIDSILNIASSLTKFIPDQKVRADLKVKIAEIDEATDSKVIEGIMQEVMSNMDMVKLDATKSFFFAGARPLMLWGSVFGALSPVLTWLINTVQVLLMNFGAINSMIEVAGISDPATYIGIVVSAFGFGTLRTIDKFKGTQTDKL